MSKKVPFVSILLFILTLGGLFYFGANYGAKEGVTVGVTGGLAIISFELLRLLKRATYKWLGWSGFIWLAFGVILVVILWLGNWLQVGEQNLASRRAGMGYITIRYANQNPVTYILEQDGRIGFINDQHHAEYIGAVYGTTLWIYSPEQYFYLVAVKLIGEPPVLGIRGDGQTALITFSP